MFFCNFSFELEFQTNHPHMIKQINFKFNQRRCCYCLIPHYLSLSLSLSVSPCASSNQHSTFSYRQGHASYDHDRLKLKLHLTWPVRVRRRLLKLLLLDQVVGSLREIRSCRPTLAARPAGKPAATSLVLSIATVLLTLLARLRTRGGTLAEAERLRAATVRWQ